MLTLDGGLQLATIPAKGDRWRVVVANTTRAAALQEMVTLGLASTSTQEKAQAWADGLASLGLGYVLPPATLAGELFVVDVKFPTSTPVLLPLVSIVERWQQVASATQVVRIAPVPLTENAAASASARASLLAAAGEELKRESVGAKLQQAASTALGTLKLGLWAVIVGGVVVLVMKSRTFRR